MYLTAQRVRSPRGQRGINVAFHTHEGTAIPTDLWGRAPEAILDHITRTEPGNTFAATVAVAPGGNSVETFLDVVAPDGTQTEAIKAALDRLRTQLTSTRPSPVRVGRVVTAFAANLSTSDVASDFAELADAALAFHRAPTQPAWVVREPLVIEGTNDADGWSFALVVDSAARVRSAGGTPARVNIRHDVASDFRRLHGALYPHVAEWVTSLTSEQLLELGGARFIHQGRVVGEWPKRS